MSDQKNIAEMKAGQAGETSDTIPIEEQLAKFEKFVARRFDEISMEINATSQLLDMAEDGAEKRFNNMLGALHDITTLTDGSSSANTGAELEAAVRESEDAANRIMDAAEEIGKLLKVSSESSDNPELQFTAEQIDTHIQEILLACSFQDLVGQRIRKAVEQLKGVETELSETLSNMGLPTVESQKSPPPSAGNATQDDIDALFD